MSIPDYESLMLPLLQITGDRSVHSIADLVDKLAERCGLDAAEKKELLPSGREPTFANRVRWAKTYLKNAGLLTIPERGRVRITERGLRVLEEAPERIDYSFLMRYDEFLKWRETRKDDAEGRGVPKPDDNIDPEEALETAYQRLRIDLAADILNAVKGCSSAFFERLVIDLLVKMGYGGTRKDAGEAIGRSGDEGIDGIIKEDRLGLDAVYVQAKRWENQVGRPEIQKFAGALQGQRARKGVFITTSTFSGDANEYVSKIDSKIVLIDGETLAQLMIDHDVGVSLVTTYPLKRIDSDYFVED